MGIQDLKPQDQNQGPDREDKSPCDAVNELSSNIALKSKINYLFNGVPYDSNGNTRLGNW